MTEWRALTLKQPWVWAICHAGKDVENRSWPIPPKLLNRNRPCEYCVSGSVGEYHNRGEHMPGCRASDLIHAGPCWAPCEECNGSAVEPLRVMLHAGAAWDRAAFPKLPGWEDYAALPNGTQVWAHDVFGGIVTNSPTFHIDKRPLIHEQPFGAVVAVVEFTGCHEAKYGAENPTFPAVGWSDEHEFQTWCCEGNPWAQVPGPNDWDRDARRFDPTVWHWEIGSVHVLNEPVAAKGRQRLWFPDGEVVAVVEAQLAP